MKSHRVTLTLLVMIASVATLPGPALGYDFATTHAGLTEQAVLASSLHRVLVHRLGRSLGLFETIQLQSRGLAPGAWRALSGRLSMLDPAAGYRPGSEGSASALSWVVAGSVLAGTPPERGRHTFFDPRKGRGLDDGPGLTGLVHAARLVVTGQSTIRSLAAGTTFDLTGEAPLSWLRDPRNDLGVEAFVDGLDASMAAADVVLRDAGLVRALLALGGILAVLQDAGEPAHVRNDFRGAYLGSAGSSSGSAFERLVSDRYARAAIPKPDKAVARPTLASFFAAGDRLGLADLVQRNYFSPGTLPADGVVDPDTTTQQVVRDARESLLFVRPTVTRLDLHELGKRRYMMLDGRRALAYMRVPGRVRFFLDSAVYEDTARALLPMVGAYAAGLLDHLFRGELTMQTSGGQVTLGLAGWTAAPTDGSLRVFAEDRHGVRSPIPLPSGGSNLIPGTQINLELPPGTRRVAAVWRGRDGRESIIAVGEAVVE